MKRVYIAGPMTGRPDLNYPAFHHVAERLRKDGFIVENPAENNPPPCGTWAGWMRLALAQLITCDIVFLLPGWYESEGVRLEFQVATSLNLQIIIDSTY